MITKLVKSNLLRLWGFNKTSTELSQNCLKLKTIFLWLNNFKFNRRSSQLTFLLNISANFLTVYWEMNDTRRHFETTVAKLSSHWDCIVDSFWPLSASTTIRTRRGQQAERALKAWSGYFYHFPVLFLWGGILTTNLLPQCAKYHWNQLRVTLRIAHSDKHKLANFYCRR